MIVQRSALAAARRAATTPIVKRSFTTSLIRNKDASPKASPPVEGKRPKPGDFVGAHKLKTFEEIKGPEDLLGPGAQPGKVPTDLDQSTGLERLEILGKNEGVDIFDMRPLDASRVGTMEDPIKVRSAGEEQYCGCTGCPADSHHTIWLTLSKTRPLERCPECGSVYEMEYVGAPEDPHAHDHGHGHDHHAYEELKTFADYIPKEYRYQ